MSPLFATLVLCIVLWQGGFAHTPSERSAHSFGPPRRDLVWKRASPQVSGQEETLWTRRVNTIVSESLNASDVPAWLKTLQSNGTWPSSEIDYTAGCAAQRANWPAYFHWLRIVTMASAWNGGLANSSDSLVQNQDLQSSISSTMDWWFSLDFTNIACLDQGGLPACPCNTPGLWNSNWFSSIILVPKLVGRACLVMNDTLSGTQRSNCTHMTSRAYATFGYKSISGLGTLTGANALDVSSVGVDLALLTANTTLLPDAYGHAHREIVVEQKTGGDGIRPDGGFGQHAGMLYNGNYGKDFRNDILDLDGIAGGTRYSANDTAKSAFTTLMFGDQWMIYRNSLTGIPHYDYSVLGRFISFSVLDTDQAVASIHFNLSQLLELGTEWGSQPLQQISQSLMTNTTHANVGNIAGNRMFYDNDYMVHRGPGYVTSVKMYSKRTTNSECLNDGNPFGFHLSDGAVHTYLRGDEYEDIAVAWDWNLIPGITVDYGDTPLTCDKTQHAGIQTFVGGVSDGDVGIAAMRYTNPETKALRWQKAWFFLPDDVQHVMAANVTSTEKNAQIYSVLDQRLHNGDVLVDGKATQTANFTSASTLWHGGVGYKFEDFQGNFGLSVQTGNRSGNWTSLGTSNQPRATFDLFSAYISHKNPNVTSLAYTAFPGTDSNSFNSKSSSLQLQTARNDVDVSAVLDIVHGIAMVVFWDPAGGNVTFSAVGNNPPITVTSDGNAAVIYRRDKRTISVSDPSQNLTTVSVVITAGNSTTASHVSTMNFNAKLPTSGNAGASVIERLPRNCIKTSNGRCAQPGGLSLSTLVVPFACVFVSIASFFMPKTAPPLYNAYRTNIRL